MIYFKNILLEIESEEAAEKAAKEIGEKLDDILKQELNKQNEGILTISAFALALPGLLNSIAKIAQIISKKYYKTIDLTKPNSKAWYNVLDKFTEKIDSYIDIPFNSILKPIIPDNVKRKKVINILKSLAIATMAVVGNIDMSKSLKALAYLKSTGGAFSNEILQYISERNLPNIILWAKKELPALVNKP